MKRTKYFVLGIIASLSLSVFAAVFNQFQPATGILVGSASSYITSAANSGNVIALWSGTCSGTTFLRGDGACAAAGGGGGGVTFTDGTNTVSAATQLTFSGGTISGTTPNAVVTIAGSAPATTVSLGTSLITDVGAGPTPVVASMVISPNAGSGNPGDCVTFVDGTGSVGDRGATSGGGVLGPCTIADPNGHPNLIAANGGAVITGTGCTGDPNAQDNTGAVTVSASTTCTITFGSTFTTNFASNPFCVVAGYSAGVLPFISTPPSSTSVQVHTAAAGTFAYHCF